MEKKYTINDLTGYHTVNECPHGDTGAMVHLQEIISEWDDDYHTVIYREVGALHLSLEQAKDLLEMLPVLIKEAKAGISKAKRDKKARAKK